MLGYSRSTDVAAGNHSDSALNCFFRFALPVRRDIDGFIMSGTYFTMLLGFTPSRGCFPAFFYGALLAPCLFCPPTPARPDS